MTCWSSFRPGGGIVGGTGDSKGSRCGDSRGGVEVFLGFDLHLVYTTKLFVQPMCRRTRAAPLEE